MDVKHERLCFVFLLGAAVFNILDYFLTMKVLAMGYEEWNPIIKNILGTELLPNLKLVIIPFTLHIIWLFRDLISYRLVYYSGLVFSVYLLLMLYFLYIVY